MPFQLPIDDETWAEMMKKLDEKIKFHESITAVRCPIDGRMYEVNSAEDAFWVQVGRKDLAGHGD